MTTSNSRRAPCSRGFRGRRITCSIRRNFICNRRIRRRRRLRTLYEEYRKELRKANALDFDDLLLEAMRLLKTASAVREYYNQRFQYLLIDEYQDTNRPQYELMRMLAGDAAQRVRRGRRGPVDLFLARRGHPQHSGVREGFSGSEDYPPGAELPLDTEHFAGSVGGGGEQRSAKRQESVDRRGRAARRSATTKRRTEKTKRYSPPTTSRSICARPPSNGGKPSRGCAISHEFAIAFV